MCNKLYAKHCSLCDLHIHAVASNDEWPAAEGSIGTPAGCVNEEQDVEHSDLTDHLTPGV